MTKKLLSKTTIRTLFFFFLFGLKMHQGMAQTVAIQYNEATAYLTFNGEKSPSINGAIEFNTSFFIKNFTLPQQEKQAHITKVLNSKMAFTDLQLTDVTENRDASIKSTMVVINLSGKDIVDLSNKIKFLFTELGVNKINYNNKEYTTQNFSF